MPLSVMGHITSVAIQAESGCGIVSRNTIVARISGVIDDGPVHFRKPDPSRVRLAQMGQVG